jgi:multiple antibiotic resistance protein
VIRGSVAFAILFFVALVYRASSGGFETLLKFSAYNTAYIVLELVAIIDPIGALPIFLVFVSEMDANGRRKVVETMTTVVIALLFFFSLLGQPLLSLLGVNVTSFEFGGGIILLFLALDMLSSGNVTRSINTDEIAVVPLATPLLVGPGTMTALIVLTNQASTPLLDVLVGCGIATLITFYFSEYIFKLLGQNGVKAISRLFTIILAAIAAQMIHSALLAWGLAKF